MVKENVMNAKAVISGEVIPNDSLDTLLMDERGHTILRNPLRDGLEPCQTFEKQKKTPKKRRTER